MKAKEFSPKSNSGVVSRPLKEQTSAEQPNDTTTNPNFELEIHKKLNSLAWNATRKGD